MDEGSQGEPPIMPDTRDLPVPMSISPEARAFLLASGADPGPNATLPEPEDLEGWRANVRARHEPLLGMFRARNSALMARKGIEPPTVDLVSVESVPVYRVTPADLTGRSRGLVYLEIHGGAFVWGGGDCCREMGIAIASRVELPTWAVDYRMPPDHPYPAALEDCITVYRALLQSHPSDRVVVGGSSAGGNLACALVLRARDEGVALPAALVLLSPQVDLSESGDTYRTNLGADTVLKQSLSRQNQVYAGGLDLTDPRVSPLFADFASPFPPTLLQSGTRDLFLSNTVRLHRRLRSHDIDADLHVFEAMPHGGFGGAPEDEDLDTTIRRFIVTRVGR